MVDGWPPSPSPNVILTPEKKEIYCISWLLLLLAHHCVWDWSMSLLVSEIHSFLLLCGNPLCSLHYPFYCQWKFTQFPDFIPKRKWLWSCLPVSLHTGISAFSFPFSWRCNYCSVLLYTEFSKLCDVCSRWRKGYLWGSRDWQEVEAILSLICVGMLPVTKWSLF